MVSSPSSIEDLKAAIRSQNPFDRSFVVRQQDVWGRSFPDVASLNAHASDAVFEAVRQVRVGQRQVAGITITAEKGLGKSHVISRIRHRLQEEGSALFVYMRQYGDLGLIKYQFLQTLAASLKKTGSQDVMQWQELAAALVNGVMKRGYTARQLAEGFPGELARNPKLIDTLTAKILQGKPDIDNPYIIQAILWTLSQAHAPFAINWLSGSDLAQSKADAMGLPNPSKEEKEAESFNTVRQILDLISDYSSLVVCFDELDGTEYGDPNDDSSVGGFTRAQVAASLAKDLYDNIKCGVLLMAMYPETWQDQVKAIPYAAAVIDRIGEQVIDLRHLNSDNVVALVSQWLKEFYGAKGLTSTHPVYPFEEGQLRELGKDKPTIRKVLQWCKNSFSVPDDVPITIAPPLIPDPVESAFSKELESLEDFLEDKVLLSQTLAFCFSKLIGQNLEKVKIEKVETVIAPRSANKGFIDFKVVGKEDSRTTVKIGVAIIQSSTGVSVQAGLSRLIDYRKFDLTRGCLIRSKKVSSNAKKAQGCLKQLLEKGGEWVLLKEDEAKPLIAIYSVCQSREDYELSEEQILNFISQTRLISDSPLIREILSDPSGRVPNGAVDEDVEINISESANESVGNNATDLADLIN